MSFSMLYFSMAWVAQSTASCCMSSDMSAFLITAFLSVMVADGWFVPVPPAEEKEGSREGGSEGGRDAFECDCVELELLMLHVVTALLLLLPLQADGITANIDEGDTGGGGDGALSYVLIHFDNTTSCALPIPASAR